MYPFVVMVEEENYSTGGTNKSYEFSKGRTAMKTSYNIRMFEQTSIENSRSSESRQIDGRPCNPHSHGHAPDEHAQRLCLERLAFCRR